MSDRVPHLLNEAQSNPDWRERRLALIDLSYEKDESIVPVLMDKLDDPISEVRHAAIMAISRTRSRRSSNPDSSAHRR